MNDQTDNKEEKVYTNGAFPQIDEIDRTALTSVADDDEEWNPLKEAESPDDDERYEENKPIDDGTEENESLEEQVGDDDFDEE